MSKENPNEFKIINKNERLHYRLIINQLKQQLEEKDKEIERLKNLFKLNNEVVINQGKEIFDLRVQVLQQKQNQTQLAIQELEKIINIFEPYENDNRDTILNLNNNVSFIDYIEQRIQELKGE